MFKSFISRLDNLFNGRISVDEDMLDELEELLLQSDVGMETAELLTGRLREVNSQKGFRYADEVRSVLADEILSLLHSCDGSLALKLEARPSTVLVTGVNGSGKTTAVGKLAARLKNEGKKVVVAAADTFRAAAADQLAVWCERAGVDMIRHQEGSDPGAVVYDTLQAAKARGMDVVLVDTAGRLQNKVNLMEELKKIVRVIDRVTPTGLSETLLALDAATGRNSLSQARLFNEAAGLTGMILNKVDGTARGGAILSIIAELKLPVKFIGTGEKISDLQPFDPDIFAREMAGSE